MVHHPIAARTARLRLDPLTSADAADLLGVYGNPDTWRHMPEGRFTDIDMALANIAKSEHSHREYGLGTWAIRIDAAGSDASLPEGTFIGTGGVRYLKDAGVWNLGYRLDPRSWGRGFATEVALAAIKEAAAIAPRAPVTGRALANNSASLAVLEKVGLTLIWEGYTADAPRPATGSEPPLRRLYSDRELTPSAHNWLIAHA